MPSRNSRQHRSRSRGQRKESRKSKRYDSDEDIEDLKTQFLRVARRLGLRDARDDLLEGYRSITSDFEERIEYLQERCGDFQERCGELGGETDVGNLVDVKVEASLKYPPKPEYRNDRPCFIWNEPIPLPNSPGFACVGRVISDPPEGSNFKKGDKIASMITKGEHFDYLATVPVSEIIKIPEDVDSGSAVVLLVTYMVAYQCLSMGQNDLKNKQVLISGGIGPVCQACIELALIGGAIVYVPALTEYHPFLSEKGAQPIECHPLDWNLPAESIDIIVESICADELKTPLVLLKPEGQLIWIGSSALEANAGLDWKSQAEKHVIKYAAELTTPAIVYGLLNSWKNDRDSFERDINHLFYLYANDKIHPKVSAYASVDDYSKLKSGIKGVVVCVPEQD